jgi:hypothetical protein
MDISDVYEVGDYEISSFCLQSFPCKHSFKKPNNEWRILNAVEIYEILKADGLSHPHFEYCKEVIRRRDNPTPEEIAERETREERVREAEIKRREQENELNKIIDKYKASSRIEKLKASHNLVK